MKRLYPKVYCRLKSSEESPENIYLKTIKNIVLKHKKKETKIYIIYLPKSYFFGFYLIKTKTFYRWKPKSEYQKIRILDKIKKQTTHVKCSDCVHYHTYRLTNDCQEVFSIKKI